MENRQLSDFTGKKVIDWNRTQEDADRMDLAQAQFAWADCVETAEIGVPRDAGYYMDCASIYGKRAEKLAKEAN